jgi:hypothetical protein
MAVELGCAGAAFEVRYHARFCSEVSPTGGIGETSDFLVRIRLKVVIVALCASKSLLTMLAENPALWPLILMGRITPGVFLKRTKVRKILRAVDAVIGDRAIVLFNHMAFMFLQ